MLDHIPARAWHHDPPEETAGLLASDLRRGLGTSEAEERRARFGRNEVTAKRRTGPLMRFLLQFHQPLIYILIAAGAVTAALGEWVDSSVIFGVVLVNAFVGDLRKRMPEAYIINPAEHFVEGMDGDDLMFMWERVQRSGYITV